jgi:protein phosphatase
MKLPRRYAVGTATHTGLVRGSNEDDFLVGALPVGLLLCAIADGMGGVAGGAEASRIALRALGTTVLDGDSAQSTDQRFRRGFDAASRHVHAESTSVPALRDMGTTLTALCFDGAAVQLGHVGDTRAYRCRGGTCEQLTTDHATRQPQNLLLRCIGGGKDHCEVDHAVFVSAAGDRFLLLSDGVWSTVPPRELVRIAPRGDAQAAAEALVTAALRAGGPDNATAIVVDVLDPTATGQHELDLPREERPSGRGLWPQAVSLRPPVWAGLAWAFALVLLGAVGLRWIWHVDVWGWLAGITP